MRSYPNIDRSGFTPGQYVAYGPAHTWRIRREGRTWRAFVVRGKYEPSIVVATLGEVSARVASVRPPLASVGAVS